MWFKVSKTNLEVSALNTSKIVVTSSSLNKGKLWDIGSLKVANLTTFFCKRWILLR